MGRLFWMVVKMDDLGQQTNDANFRISDGHVHFGTAGTLELGKRRAVKMGQEMSKRF